ncbi:interferon alpha-inducible protein 27, mitochondrial-like [Ruditapes philippinarum]|uniref:interferon alpha-inducible protein 27, mitochondrial-like n=1 Tax=Ruditapes philippinarum TaxID=129788 RepID=UPI00295B2BD7|nr:interferon alpha-inducible protein 27, mitochondrial-like [Ruditapes philippinarum]XP_060608671.1 interferon alpha-inducible protein 27, mitochondrial-like [Ruditapes philippinarum]XP_060608672.1 interferon alpha-inducible protein 27, mitochondrial-like [Ruditapes philippinarum]
MSTLEQINQAVSKIPLKKIGSCIGTPERLENIPWKKIGIATAVAVPSVYVGAPFFISTLGFKAGGIAAGSVAAKWMSMVAVANGGGIPATSIVAAMQISWCFRNFLLRQALFIGSAVSGAVCLAPSTNNIHVAEDTSSKNCYRGFR